ncbi:MAG: 23S rRNA (adenine(2503)-C(2))-methyltransferase RlmN [Halanaerobiales bacterium]|nr:23S rRNA (adenine(2503)-C(2))-methyltransferase RlmN [Halanaerobiales bacterium]
MIKTNILNFTLEELKEDFKIKGIKQYRAKQVFNWIYRNGILEFTNMNNLPNDLIKGLKKNYKITSFKLDKKLISEDGTLKYLWKTEDDKLLESVFLPYEEDNRYSICVSSQIGCSLGCKFCATGIDGLKRDLNTGEIVEQVLRIQVDVSYREFKIPQITNIVFMGMGEPFLNYNNVMKAVQILNSPKALNIAKRKITISTAGVVDKIIRIAEREEQLGLAISLNAPNDQLRDELMPINKKYNIKKIMKAVDYYIQKTNRRVSFEYVLMEGINDKEVHLFQLISLLKNKLVHLNLIPLNPVPELDISRSPQEVIDHFQKKLRENNITVTVRKEKGTNIKAACGQLRSSHKNGGS